jgi:hypothetical protein
VEENVKENHRREIESAYKTAIAARNFHLDQHNSTYTQVAVQWLNQALCFYQSLCLADSESLRNRHLRVAANRYSQWHDERNTKY